jgi:hypothetical protein
MKVKTQVKAGILDNLAVSIVGQSATTGGTASNSGQNGVVNVGVIV